MRNAGGGVRIGATKGKPQTFRLRRLTDAEIGARAVAAYKAELAEKVRALYVIRFGDPEMASRNTIAAVIALMEESE